MSYRNNQQYEYGKKMEYDWYPDDNVISNANITKLLKKTNFPDIDSFYDFSVDNPAGFWEMMIDELGIRFDSQYDNVLDISNGAANPIWLESAMLNIANSCFMASDGAPAIIYHEEQGDKPQVTSHEKLNKLSNQVANAIENLGLPVSAKIAIDMVMNMESIAIYLGIIKAGCAVVAIADSFAPDEIKVRLDIAKADAIFTQDVILRGGKRLPLFAKVAEAIEHSNKPDIPIITLPARDHLASKEQLDIDEELWQKYSKQIIAWGDFIASASDYYDPISCKPYSPINILFSSGTTGEPKAIVWDHTTPIKSASDGYLYQDVHEGDVFCWPTNLGWMMGPWLIFATLINKGTIALYGDAPIGKGFGEFVQDARVNILGVIPSIVKSWRANNDMESLDWSSVRLFTSTGEASNPDDYRYLMALGADLDSDGNPKLRPVIEYCGGTEIGGAYITSTVMQPSIASAFAMPAFGLDLVLYDEEKNEFGDQGELYIVPPSIGLSQVLLNRDHYQTYYDGTPAGPRGQQLRRHGDELRRLPNGYYKAQGRADDTMNLGGIKASSVDIERAIERLAYVSEVAAIAVNPADGGPSNLVIFAVLNDDGHEKQQMRKEMRKEMQSEIREHLNPLFKISDVVIVDKLPRTASNKVMRRSLRDRYGG